MIEIWIKEQYSFEGLLKLFISIHKNSKGLIMSYISLNRTKGTVIHLLEVLIRIWVQVFSQKRPAMKRDINTYEQIKILSYLLK